MSSKKITPPGEPGNGFKYGIIATIILIIIGFAGLIAFNNSRGAVWWPGKNDTIDNLSMEYTKEGDGQGEYVTFYTDKNAKYVVSMFTDPRCPICGQFEREHTKTIGELISRGDTAFRVHMTSFLDDNTKSDYSKMISSAFKILVEKDTPQTAWNFYTTMWNNQPSERAPKDSLPTAEEIAKSAEAMGASQESVELIDKMDIHYADNMNEENIKSLEEFTGSVGTPSVFINGIYQPNALSPNFFDEIVNNDVPEDALLADGINSKGLLKVSATQ